MFVAILKGLNKLRLRVRSNKKSYGLNPLKLSLGKYLIFLYAATNVMTICNEPGIIKDPQVFVIPNPLQIKAGVTHAISISFELSQEIVSGTKVDVDLFINTTPIPCILIEVFDYCII